MQLKSCHKKFNQVARPSASHISAADAGNTWKPHLPPPPRAILPWHLVNTEPIKRSLSAHSPCVKGQQRWQQLNGKCHRALQEESGGGGCAWTGEQPVGSRGQRGLAVSALQAHSAAFRCLELILKHTFRRCWKVAITVAIVITIAIAIVGIWQQQVNTLESCVCFALFSLHTFSFSSINNKRCAETCPFLDPETDVTANQHKPGSPATAYSHYGSPTSGLTRCQPDFEFDLFNLAKIQVNSWH